MKTTKCLTISLLITLFTVGSVLAQDLVIYPAKGQSQEQMDNLVIPAIYHRFIKSINNFDML